MILKGEKSALPTRRGQGEQHLAGAVEGPHHVEGDVVESFEQRIGGEVQIEGGAVHRHEQIASQEQGHAQGEEHVLGREPAEENGGQQEIVQATQKLAEQVSQGLLKPEDIDEKMLQEALYTADQPPVDLILRPSGEYRLSNFLIWQSAYAEFVFMDVLWPDFKEEDLDRAFEEYARRDRRFGGVK